MMQDGKLILEKMSWNGQKNRKKKNFLLWSISRREMDIHAVKNALSRFVDFQFKVRAAKMLKKFKIFPKDILSF